MDIVETLKKTKTELQTRGRITGELVDGNGCVCLLGAVGIAVVGEDFAEDESKRDYGLFYGDGEATPVVEALVEQLPEKFRHFTLVEYGPDYKFDYDDAIGFNDGFVKEDDEVYALIDRAIEAQVA